METTRISQKPSFVPKGAVVSNFLPQSVNSWIFLLYKLAFLFQFIPQFP